MFGCRAIAYSVEAIICGGLTMADMSRASFGWTSFSSSKDQNYRKETEETHRKHMVLQERNGAKHRKTRVSPWKKVVFSPGFVETTTGNMWFHPGFLLFRRSSHHLGGPPTPCQVIQMGASWTPLVVNGDFWRLTAASRASWSGSPKENEGFPQGKKWAVLVWKEGK